jgi:hypothetical protein
LASRRATASQRAPAKAAVRRASEAVAECFLFDMSVFGLHAVVDCRYFLYPALPLRVFKIQ